MASQETADTAKDAVQKVADQVKDMSTSDGTQPTLFLDEVTGERVSKTELKKRQKQREKDAKKAEREATKQAPPQPKRKAASQEEEEGKLSANVSITAISSSMWARLTRLATSNILRYARERSNA